MHQIFVEKLKNGLHVLYDHNPAGEVTHCALMIRAGTRDEPGGKEGLAHFIEHTLFKGTRKRKAFYILNHLETVGGELNAYTTKEETCLHASVMNQHLERAAELISDIAFNASFPDKELQKEKDVIIDEIHAYEDTPYEQIYDDFETFVFRGHSMGHPILGTIESVQNFRRNDIINYIRQHYQASQMVFVVSGNAGKEKVMRVAEKYFSKNIFPKNIVRRKKFKPLKATQKTIIKSINQVHHIMGCPAYSITHDLRYELILLNNILGGPGMNSKLNLNIREKYGYTYSIESGYHAHSDSGLFHIYFATDEKNFNKVLALVEKELQKIIKQPLSERQLAQYKRQLIGQITMAQEHKVNLMLGMARSLLNFKKVLSLNEVSQRIESITMKNFMKVANEILFTKNYSSLTYLPGKKTL